MPPTTPPHKTQPIPIAPPRPLLHDAPTATYGPIPPPPPVPERKVFDGFSGAILFGALVGSVVGLVAGGFTSLVYLTGSHVGAAASVVAGVFVAFFVGSFVGFIAFCLRGGLSLGRSVGRFAGSRYQESTRHSYITNPYPADPHQPHRSEFEPTFIDAPYED